MQYLSGLWFIVMDIDDPNYTYRAYNASKTLMTVWSKTINNLLNNTYNLFTYDKACVKGYTQLQDTVIINSILCTLEQAQEAYPEYFI